MEPVFAVIPAYHEAATIAQVASAARPYVDRVIVVDDGSKDGTAAALAGLDVTLLRHEVNQGKAAALWHGMELALAERAAAVITLDGDGQHDTGEIPPLIEAWREQPLRLVIGARLIGREHTPPLRLFGNRMADFWIAWASGQPVRDSQSGFRLYPAELLANTHLPHHRGRSFVFESEILIEAERLGYPVRTVAVRCIYPENRRPSHYRPTADTLHIIAMVARRLILRGMRPVGLLRSLGILARRD
ncbi:MAG TPA: glycosyltransferase family 2 protein [Thioalkalivibrio sp.]|nr:glycosyltransferase family 2 protein [Thioalkalivibrio sp.]